MSGLLSKYFGQDSELYNFPVSAYSDSGVPIRGNAEFLRGEEREQLPHYCDFKAEWFRMWVPEERDRYILIMDHAYNGMFTIRQRRDVEVPRTGDDGCDLKIWLEWVQWYAEAGKPTMAPGFGPTAGALTVPVEG